MRLLGIALTWIALVAPASIAQAQRASTFSIEITPAGVPGWQAQALATALAADLADAELRAPAAGKPAEVIVRGELTPTELRYEITSKGVPVRGAVELRGLDRTSLAGILGDEIKARVHPHGDAVMPGLPAEIDAPGALGGALAGLAGLALVLAAPLLFGALVLRARVARLRATRRVGLALVGIAGVAYALVAHGELVPELGGAVLLAGGLAWGTFAAAMLPVAMPPLIGLHRVSHGELAATLSTWLWRALQRCAAMAALLVPAGLLLDLIGDGLGIPAAITFGVLAPMIGLAFRLAWRTLVEVLAVQLDTVLVDGDATELQPWHPQVRAYFLGYLRRANLDVDEGLLERVRFLPGWGHAVAIYGGGLGHTRIVIGRAMLEHALAPYGRPHDYMTARVSTLHWTHWNQGLVMPTEPGAKLASKEERRPSATVEDGEHERLALGEPPTLTGIIEPVAFDPRTSYRPGDDPLWLDWDPGEEYDGTDAGDKDYLFGFLVHAIGTMQRHEDRGATLAHAWRTWIAPRRGAQIVARATAPLRALASRRGDALGDVHAALGGARHHLAQYLAWQLWHRDDLITARAYVPELEAKSRAILAALASDDDCDPDLRRRLAQLRLFVTGVREPRSQRQRIAFAFAVLAGLAGVAALVVQAILYHSTYEDRMTAQQQQRTHERPDDGTGQ